MIASSVGVRRLASRTAAGALAVVVSLAAALALAAAPASALKTRVPLFSFSVTKPGGVAVDQASGDVYVVDGTAKAVRKFDANGNPVNFTALGSSELPISGFSGTGQLAVDPTTGSIYVGFGSKVDRFAPSGEPANFTAGPAAGTNVLTGADDPSKKLGSVFGLAVDGSGNLFVSQNSGPGAVDEFASSGAYAGLEITGAALKFPLSLALGSSGAIYDIENGTGDVLEFNPAGSLVGTCDSSGLAKSGSLASEPVAGQVLVSHSMSSASSEYVASVAQYAASCAAKQLEFRYVFGPAAKQTVAGLAVNSTSTADAADGHVYASNNPKGLIEVFGPPAIVPDVTTLPASDVGVGVATLNGTVDSDGTGAAEAFTGCRFEYVTEAAFQADVAAGGSGFSSLASGGFAPCTSVDGKAISSPGEIPNDDKSHTVTAEISGLPANTVYHARLEAANANGANPAAPQLTFQSAGPPSVEATYATGVDDTIAEVTAEIDPHLLATTYQLQYVDDSTYRHDVEALGAGHGFDHTLSAPASPAYLGEGDETVVAQVLLSGLAPSTTYHYRVIAANGFAPQGVEGPQHTLTTEPPGLGLTLPDDRAWELVSPPNKHGALIAGLGPMFEKGDVQAAADGEAITYPTSAPASSEPAGYSWDSQVMSTRAPGGWSSQDISTRNEKAVGAEQVAHYQLFSEDLSLALVNPYSAGGGLIENTTLLSSRASSATPYIRSQALCETEAAAAECFLPLFTAKEGYADVPQGAVFGTEGSNEVQVEGATAPLSHVIVKTSATLTETPTSKGELYEWTAGVSAREAVQLVSLLPESEGGEPAPGPIVVAGGNVDGGIALYSGTRNAISADGSRVFWQTPGHLYMRDLEKGETIRLDVKQAGAPAGGNAFPDFQAATADGSRVFFTDEQALTAEAGTSTEPGRGDLYVCEIVEEAGKDSCQLTDLTPKQAGQSAEVRKFVLGMSEDASYIYFAANGVLAPGATPGGCGAFAAPSVVCNLYVAHEEGGAWRTKLIATLSMGDTQDWSGEGNTTRSLAQLTARVSANGRYVAFMSDRPLTGYDNLDLHSGKPDEEVYLYDATSERLLCASCNPTGARPLGVEAGQVSVSGQGSLNLADVEVGEPTQFVAADLPPGTRIGEGASLYQSRLLFDDGRLFFNSYDALAPQDVDGTADVYEYEPPGVGSCTTSSLGYSERSGGCIELISAGSSPVESGFVDASESGNDVFFVTAEKLVRQDVDTAYDIYDAHVCTTQRPCAAALASSPPCTTADACRAAPSPQPSVFGATASATFSGAGNAVPAASTKKVRTRTGLTRAQKRRRALKACRKERGKRRAVCERRARRKYRTKRTKASHAAGKSRRAISSGRGQR